VLSFEGRGVHNTQERGEGLDSSKIGDYLWTSEKEKREIQIRRKEINPKKGEKGRRMGYRSAGDA